MPIMEAENNNTTQELLKQLSNKETDFAEFVSRAENSFIKKDLNDTWQKLIEKSKLSKSDIINKSDIGYTYFYDILRGEKCPSRDKIVRLILAMQLELDDCQTVLELYNWAPLYAKDKRDSAMIYAINNNLSVWSLDELLAENELEMLK
ncbi:MAG: hypothetical protein MR823_02750 [Ruminococcus sp.]|nr:hypothetical protein [Ruminococcus sp.]MDY4910118.1 hypothetical protein [Candidatus Fimenecus sp.]